MPYAAPIEVAQAALLRIGEASITSLDDNRPPVLIFNANYGGIVEDMLTRHAWTWGTKTVPLTYQTVATFLPWSSIWVVPPGVLNIRKLTSGGIDLDSGDWTYEDGQVLTKCQYDDLAAVTNYRAPESRWPADFAECVVRSVQALFLSGLLEQRQAAQEIMDDLEGRPGRSGRIARAIIRDKRQVPGLRVERTPLAHAWRGGRGHRPFGRAC